ncbi:AAEL012501-PA [Aedes aegypti]|uniref:AAEL012501-PA n=2 Tax=Aedes aegypti TaxID=7159 RepID=A0A1S4FWS4_AEDAE|nr:uncharacterized protein LOC5576404 isoform X2 [Aedes aegypti]EAT35328.1 AAEL012501-PA [Aedes aegypti]
MGPTKMTPEDQAFNITFVGEVKKHPCLFDSNSTEYKQAPVQDKAWIALSASVGESVDMCKKRWRNLRCCMTRYLKSVRDNVDNNSSLRRKPYYLYNHMQFVIPYLKMKDGETTAYESEDSIWIKNHNSDEIMKSEEIGEEVAEEEEEDDHDIESIDVQDEEHHQQIKQSIIQSIKILPMNQESQAQETTTTYEIIEATPAKQPRIEAIHQITPASAAQHTQHQPTQHIIKSKDVSYKNFTYATVAAPHPSGTTVYTSTPTITGQYTLQQQQTPSPSSSTSNLHRQQNHSPQQVNMSGATDADNNFFKSLIPDIQSMDMHQKRKLKIGILRLIDEILSTS